MTPSKRQRRCDSGALAFRRSSAANQTQAFCKEAVTWKHLAHPNVLPLLGITVTPFQLISNWVSGGNLLEYIQGHPDADRHALVSAHPVAITRPSDRTASFVTLLKASATSIPAT